MPAASPVPPAPPAPRAWPSPATCCSPWAPTRTAPAARCASPSVTPPPRPTWTPSARPSATPLPAPAAPPPPYGRLPSCFGRQVALPALPLLGRCRYGPGVPRYISTDDCRGPDILKELWGFGCLPPCRAALTPPPRRLARSMPVR